MWDRYKKYLFYNEALGLAVDISRVPFPHDYLSAMTASINQVYEKMAELEQGAIANPDEGRMVGHYWLRDPRLAPEPAITQEILDSWQGIKDFTQKVHQGRLTGERGRNFSNYLLIGIGGSSLGPRFVSDALGSRQDQLKPYFIDNTDPDGMDRIFAQLEGELDRTLTIVISKSGGTVETRNAMEEARLHYQNQGLDFSRHAVSITQEDSKLDQLRKRENWLAFFPMWDWVGGRTSILSGVGLLPLALQGIDTEGLLAGARQMDLLCRNRDTEQNPGALLTLMWYWLTGGKGGQQLVMLPYKDRLELLTKYLQQLIMESLGKEQDMEGKTVHQGLSVLGNKGSTDQHSYVQQLLEGPDNFFVTFIQVLKDRWGFSPLVGERSTSGDYLQAFYLGTRQALTMKNRQSITITLEKLDSFSLGALIALFERTVSMYAFLININAYHQPGVELGKKSAGEIIALKNQGMDYLANHPQEKFTVEELAQALGRTGDEEHLFQLLWHLSLNGSSGIAVEKNPNPLLNRYWMKG